MTIPRSSLLAVQGFQPGLYLLQRARDEMLPGFVEPPLMEVLALQGCTLWRLAAEPG